MLSQGDSVAIPRYVATWNIYIFVINNEHLPFARRTSKGVFMVGYQKNFTHLVSLTKKKGWVGPNICLLCHKDGKFSDYLLLNCHFTSDLCVRCVRFFGVNRNIRTCSSLESKACVNSNTSKLVRILIVTLCQNVQRERNNIVFNSTTRSLHTYMRMIIHDVIFLDTYTLGRGTRADFRKDIR